MSWIKRNLIFVVCLAAGLGLAGYSGWLLYNNLRTVSTVQSEFSDDLGQLAGLQKTLPRDPDAIIRQVTDDQRHVMDLLEEMNRVFVPWPAPPKEDERGFKAYLGQTVSDLATAATNAGVQLPDDFAFGFTKQQSDLNYPAENIQPWMGQLAEIRAVCEVLYEAKVSSVVGLQRVRVSASDDGVASDYFNAAVVTNPPHILTPYKVTFLARSGGETAAVLAGLARSSNCFIVKTIDVRHDTGVKPVALAAPAPGYFDSLAAGPAGPAPGVLDLFEARPIPLAGAVAGNPDWSAVRPMFAQMRGGGRGGGGRGGGGRGGGNGGGGSPGGNPPPNTPPGNPSTSSSAPAGTPGGGGAPGRLPPARSGGPAPPTRGVGAPATVLTEGMLRVSLSVEVVKLSGGGR